MLLFANHTLSFLNTLSLELCGGFAISDFVVPVRGQGIIPWTTKKPLHVSHMRRLIQNRRHVDEKVF